MRLNPAGSSAFVLVVMGPCTRSVGITPVLIGCSAPQRVYCSLTGVLLRSAACSVSCGANCMESACGHRAWFLSNLARNFPINLSGVGISSLELQRLWAVSKSDRGELRATFGWGSQRYMPIVRAPPRPRQCCRACRASNYGVRCTRIRTRTCCRWGVTPDR